MNNDLAKQFDKALANTIQDKMDVRTAIEKRTVDLARIYAEAANRPCDANIVEVASLVASRNAKERSKVG